MRRTIGGTVFECVHPGLWVTPDRRHAIVEQMCHRVEHQWLFFRTNRHELAADPIAEPYDLEDADFWSGALIGWHFTMGELAHDVATELLTAEQIEHVRRAMRGEPRKTSYHRRILADCRSALNREAIARAWLKLNKPPAPTPSHDISNIFDDLFPTQKEP